MSRRENIRRAKEIISSRHADSVGTYEAHISEAKQKIAGFAECDALLSGTGLRILAASLGRDSESLDTIHAEYDMIAKRKRELLLKSGYPADYCDIKYHCEKCSDTGYVGIDICECLKKEIVKASLESSGLYSLTQSQSFDTFSLDYYEKNDKMIMSRNLAILKSYAQSFEAGASDSFLFIGGTGLGKTHLSTSVARAVIERGAYVVYESAVMLFADFEAKQFGRSGLRDEAEDTEKYLDCDLLIIDDLGCEMTNQFTLLCLYNILNTRIIKHKSTIISTNLSQSDLRKRYSDRVTSRIFGELKPLLFSGSDIREQKTRRSLGQNQ